MKKALYPWLLGLLVSCQPAVDFEEGDVRGNPQFYLTGELDGTPLQWQAGTQGLYMETKVAQDQRQVYESTAALQAPGCNQCPEAWEFIIRDHAASAPDAPMLPDSAFQRKNYPFFRTYNANLFRLQLQNQSFPGIGNQLVSSQWEVRDSSGQLIYALTENTPHLLLPQGQYRVRLTSTFSNGCNNSLEKIVQAAPVNTQCTADFHYSLLNNSSVIQLNAIGLSLTPPFTVQWQINGATFTGAEVSMPVSALGSGGVNVVRMTAFNSSCTTEVVKQVTQNPATFCTVNFRASSSAFNDPLQTGTLRIQYRRADGELFSTSFGDQPGDAFFQINDITSFVNTPQGLPVKQLEGTLRCILFNADRTEQMVFENGKFNLAFPYKP